MATIPKGATVTFRNEPHFDTLSLQAATDIIYNELVPTCEAKGVRLSSKGNTTVANDSTVVASYDPKKASHELFDVARIQRAFSSLDHVVTPTATFKAGSYRLKHVMEDYQGEYISNGDFIASMLVKGYSARFGKRTERMAFNCGFKAKSSLTAAQLDAIKQSRLKDEDEDDTVNEDPALFQTKL